MKISIILGTRPEIIKMSPVIRKFVIGYSFATVSWIVLFVIILTGFYYCK